MISVFPGEFNIVIHITDPPIIHRDIKASNILITEKLRAKVADFGFARLAAEDPSATHISTQIKGTAGYLDPEYLRMYQLTEKSDVYSFGVLLVEMVTGRRPIESKTSLFASRTSLDRADLSENVCVVNDLAGMMILCM
ncbi:UNVERIFIED_CONTAM: Calmodulin-binding receptor-like cytoplasmic kinase [Sesamum radiatum]|uniref:Calmodulin-binding receptor-like cytoplasmic kinase n=1 Tax=Sesamum radiatum TaxID=300843 RepID=A0AAW2URE9_SESRA